MNRGQRRRAAAQSRTGITKPSRTISQLHAAIGLMQAGRFSDAAHLYEQINRESPANALVLHHYGLTKFKLGLKHEAVELIRTSLVYDPTDARAWLNLAVILSDLKQFEEALAACLECRLRDPDHAQAWKVAGDIYSAQRRDAEAAAEYFRYLGAHPDQSCVRLRLSQILRRLHRFEEAFEQCALVLEVDSGHPDALRQKRSIAVEMAVDDAWEASPGATATETSNDAVLHLEAAARLERLGRNREAFEAYKRGLDLAPDNAGGYAQLGIVLRKLDLFAGAIKSFEESLRLDPRLLSARHNLAVTQRLLGNFAEALKNFESVLAEDPEAILTRVELTYMRRTLCDWAGLEAEEDKWLEQFRAGMEVIPPFVLFSVDATGQDQLEAARRYGAKHAVAESERFDHSSKGLARDGRIKLGYLSSDFGQHATSLLLAEVFHLHDRRRFEVTCYSLGADDGSKLRQDITDSVDSFVDLHDMPHKLAAQRIFDDGVDILLDLNGYTRHGRPEIASYRPAPIQVNYLGYPATMGAEFIDYFIADEVTVPCGTEGDFREKVVKLPGSYQANDRRRRIAPLLTDRKREGLPDDAVVLCCFNGSWKLNARMFDVWMRLLRVVDGSVLWLLHSNDTACENLRREAAARSVDPSRVIFAPKIDNASHLARHVLADIFLDCLPCNAHTTASDALWSGLPVLTCTGDTFASRVAASLLVAAGLEELVANSLSDYEARALDLARDRPRLKRMSEALIARRDTLTLFDTPAYTRSLEAAFEEMLQKARAKC